MKLELCMIQVELYYLKLTFPARLWADLTEPIRDPNEIFPVASWLKDKWAFSVRNWYIQHSGSGIRMATSSHGTCPQALVWG